MAKLIFANFQGLMAKLRLRKRTRKEEKSAQSTKDPAKVPEGFFPIYVGEQQKLYVVPIAFLSFRMFQALLNQFKEQNKAAAAGHKLIVVPCSIMMFESILHDFLHSYTL